MASLALPARVAPASEAAVADDVIAHRDKLPRLPAPCERLKLLFSGWTAEVRSSAPKAVESGDLERFVLLSPVFVAERLHDVLVTVPGGLDVYRLASTGAVGDVLTQPSLDHTPKPVPTKTTSTSLRGTATGNVVVRERSVPDSLAVARTSKGPSRLGYPVEC